MALEFALRPRLNLDAPAPRRRLPKLRLPRLALPIAAYWLGMAGVTHLLLRLTAEDSAASEVTAVELAATSTTPELAATSTTPELAATSTTPEPDVEAAPVAAPLAASEPHLERAMEPSPTEPSATLPIVTPPAAAPPAAPAPVAAAPRALKAEPQPPARALRAEPRAPEARAPLTGVEAPAQRRSEPEQAPSGDEPPRSSAPVSLPSCESVAASENESMDLRGAVGAPDLTRDAFASILENGAYLAACAVPARTALDICAAVRDGKVVGISVRTEPRSPALGACVTRAVAALRFPRNARLDVTRTRFEAVR